ncbi:MAG: hypothetical protein HOV80_29940 [Polyangiaceae bacterium]|nr:hypothetical protein [Polyangiaceae bacterium]
MRLVELMVSGRPIVALFTEPGLVLAMTADGGIMEGRHTAMRMPSKPPTDSMLRKTPAIGR